MIRALLSLSIFVTLLSLTAFPAYAQSGSSDPEFPGNAGVVILNGLKVNKRQDLSFGTIAPDTAQASTVQVYRGKNKDSVCGASLTCLSKGNRARFTLVGTPNQYVNISNPSIIYLYDGAGHQMTVDTFVGAGSGNDTQWLGYQLTRTNGLSRFNVGAVLHVKANQTPGTYVGTFTINFDYQ